MIAEPKTEFNLYGTKPDKGILRLIFSVLSDLLSHHELIWTFVQRNIKVRYKGSALGVSWFMLSPTLTVFIFWIVFTKIIRLDIPHFPIFMFIGISHWNFFTGSCLGGSHSFPENENLIRKVYFPRTIPPMTAVLTSFVQMIINFAILSPVLLLFFPVSLENLMVFPLLLLISLTFCSGVAFLLSTSHVFVRDTAAIVEILILFGFYLSPIFYPVSMVPESVRMLYKLNPVASLTLLYRNALFNDLPVDLFALSVALVWGITLFGLGVAILNKYENRIVKEV